MSDSEDEEEIEMEDDDEEEGNDEEMDQEADEEEQSKPKVGCYETEGRAIQDSLTLGSCMRVTVLGSSDCSVSSATESSAHFNMLVMV